MGWLSEFFDEWNRVRGHWQQLGTFFKMPAIRFFVSWFAFVPLFMKVFSDLPEVLRVNVAGETYELALSLPFTWQVLWLSSFFYALAFAVYTWRCPSFIKANPDFGAFLRKKHSHRWIAWELHYGWLGITDKDKLVRRLCDKGYAVEITLNEMTPAPTVEERGTVWRFEHEGRAFEVCMSERDPEDRVGDVFWELFGRWAGSRKLGRNTVWMCLILSILLFLFVVCQNIWFGIGYVLG